MLNLLSPALFVNHRGQSAANQPSTRLWSKIKGELIHPDGSGTCKGISTGFENSGAYAPAISGTVTGTLGDGWGVYVDTATSAASVSQNTDGSGMKLTTSGTDNHQASASSGGNVGGLGVLSLSGGKVVAFEARVKFTPGASDSLTFLVGAAEPASAINNSITDAGAIGAFDYLGFYTDDVADGSDIINFGYRTSGGSIQAVSGVAQAITSGTWYKVGFILDPNKSDECLTVFIDGVQVGTVSKAALDADANFPDTTNFAVLLVVKAITANSNVMDVDWLHCVLVG